MICRRSIELRRTIDARSARGGSSRREAYAINHFKQRSASQCRPANHLATARILPAPRPTRLLQPQCQPGAHVHAGERALSLH